MLDAGHERANFAIVATGPNAASPHHDPSDRVIAPGDIVLCDFGGTMHGYCSDITRMFSVGEPSAEVQSAYAVLVEAQERGVRAATVGTACEAVDAATRDVIDDGGYGEFFVHRTGHGIGTEAHEDPVRRQRQSHRARTRARVQHRARHLRTGALRPAARGHRRRNAGGAGTPQRGAARPRDRRLIGARCNSTWPRCWCRSPPAACCSAGSRPVGARWASATGGCCGSPSDRWRSSA